MRFNFSRLPAHRTGVRPFNFPAFNGAISLFSRKNTLSVLLFVFPFHQANFIFVLCSPLRVVFSVCFWILLSPLSHPVSFLFPAVRGGYFFPLFYITLDSLSVFCGPLFLVIINMLLIFFSPSFLIFSLSLFLLLFIHIASRPHHHPSALYRVV